MRLRFEIFKTQVRLVLLLGKELFLLNPATILLLLYFPGYLLFLHFVDGGIYLKPILLFMLILMGVTVARKIQFGSNEPEVDKPVLHPLSEQPAFQELVEKIGSQVHVSPPRSIAFALSPGAWRMYGVDIQNLSLERKVLAVAIGCLEVWSISEMEAHVARQLLSCSGPSWLLRAVVSACNRLHAEQYQLAITGISHWLHRERREALQRYIELLNVWRFLVDLHADVRAAQFFGASVVMSLIYKTELAYFLIPNCLETLVDPAVDQRALLPVAESCAGYFSVVEPQWKNGVDEALKELARSPSEANFLAARLQALSTLTPGLNVYDPRSAAALFTNYRLLEREVASNEFGAQRVALARDVDPAEIVRIVILPQIRQEIDRNHHLIENKSRFDIPDLVRRKTQLADNYRPDPKYLFAHSQREQGILHFLGAFLAINLLDHAWHISFTIAEGIMLQTSVRQVHPFDLIERLDAQAISEDEFLSAIL